MDRPQRVVHILAGVPECCRAFFIPETMQQGNNMTSRGQVQAFTSILLGLLGLFGCSSPTEPAGL